MTDDYAINYKIDGEVYYGSDLRENMAFSLVPILNLALDGITMTNQDSLDFDLFTSDSASVNYGFIYNSSTDLYETSDLSNVTEYVIVEATSLSAPWDEYDCKTVQIASGKWLVYCTSGTAAVHRAKILRSLFMRSIPDNNSALIETFTGVTAIKTSHANDVGKRAFARRDNENFGSSSPPATVTGTFVDTTNNTNCSTWAALTNSGTAEIRFEMPSGTTLYGTTYANNFNYLGTDTSSDEKDNPATCQIDAFDDHGSNYSYFFTLIVCSGDISWAGSLKSCTYNIDYYTDQSIPDFTAAGTLTAEGANTSTLISAVGTVTANDTAGIIKSINSIDAANTLAVSVSYDNGSNYLAVTEKTMFKITNTGTQLKVKFVLTRVDNSTADSISSYALLFG